MPSYTTRYTTRRIKFDCTFSQNAHDLGKIVTTVADLNDFIDIIGTPKEIHGDNGELEFEILDSSLNPVIISKPIVTIKDPTKLNVGFQAKVESKNHPNREGVSTNVQLTNQAKWSEGESKEFSLEEDWIKRRDATDENRKNATFRLYFPDVKDALRNKFAKTSMQLGLDVTSKKDTDENYVLIVDNRSKGKKDYIRLCKKLSDGSTSLMQKLRGKICVKMLPKNEFYFDPSANRRKDDVARLVRLKIGRKTGDGKDYSDNYYESKENKRNTVTDVEASISDISTNYDESVVKVADKLGTGLNFKMPVIDGRIANLLRDGKLSLSASTALKV